MWVKAWTFTEGEHRRTRVLAYDFRGIERDSSLLGTFRVLSLSFQEAVGVIGSPVPILGGSTDPLRFETVNYRGG
jgi:hypothetical protein